MPNKCVEFIENRYLKDLPKWMIFIPQPYFTYFLLSIPTLLTILPLVIVNATTSYSNYPPQNYTIFNEAINETGNIPTYCDSYDAEIPWHVVTSVFSILSLFFQIWTLWKFRDKLEKQQKDLKTWTGGATSNIYSVITKKIKICWYYILERWFNCDYAKNKQCDITVNENDTFYEKCKKRFCKIMKCFSSIPIHMLGIAFFLQHLFLSEFTIEILSEILDMTYIGLVQDLIYQLGDGDNLQDSRYIIRGLWFYSLFHICVIAEMVIFLCVSKSADMNCIYNKYKALLFGPLPILNIIEYLCVERMGTADEISDNWVILANNIISIIFAIDIFRKVIDMMILSWDDFRLTLRELLPTCAGFIMLYTLILRVYVNQRVSDPWHLNNVFLDHQRDNFTSPHVERQIGVLYNDGYIEKLAARLEQDVDLYLDLYKDLNSEVPCINGYCFLIPEKDANNFTTLARIGYNDHERWIMNQTMMYSVYEPWQNLSIKSNFNNYDFSDYNPEKDHHPAYVRYHFLMNQFLENIEEFLHIGDKCGQYSAQGITSLPDIGYFGETPHNCVHLKITDVNYDLRYDEEHYGPNLSIAKLFTSYEDMALFWIGYFEGRELLDMIYPMKNLEDNVPRLNIHQIAVTFLDWTLATGTFDPWTRWAYYLVQGGYVKGTNYQDGPEAGYESYKVSALEPIVNLYDTETSSECNFFYFKDANFEWFDYVIVLSSLVCVIIGFLYVTLAFLQNLEIIPELVLIRITDPKWQNYVRKFLEIGGIEACNCGTLDLDNHSPKCPVYEDPNGVNLHFKKAVSTLKRAISKEPELPAYDYKNKSYVDDKN